MSFNFTGSTLQWPLNTLAGSVTNLGNLALTTTNSKTLNGTLTNAGTITVSGSGVISIPNNGTSIVNQAGATINFQSDASILLGSSTLTGTSLVNAGTIKKTAGIGTSTINLPLTDSGIIEADSATLSFTGGGVFTGAIVNAQGAGIAAFSGTYGGTVVGSGTGAVQLGTVTAGAGGLTLNFSGSTLQWPSGTLTGPITNLGNLNLTTGGTKYFAGSFTNAGSLLVTGTGYVGTNVSNTSIINQAGATIDYQADAPLRVASPATPESRWSTRAPSRKRRARPPRPSSSRSAERARSRPTPAPSSSPAEARDWPPRSSPTAAS